MVSQQSSDYIIRTRSPKPEDFPALVAIDEANFRDRSLELGYTIEDLAQVYERHEKGLAPIAVAEDVATGEVMGYGIILTYRIDLDSRLESYYLLYPEQEPYEGPPVIFDYELEHLALKDPNHLFTRAMILRLAFKHFVNSRHITGIGMTGYSRRLYETLQFTHLADRETDEGHTYSYFGSCRYDPENRMRYNRFLDKQPVPMELVCMGCNWEQCAMWEKMRKGRA